MKVAIVGPAHPYKGGIPQQTTTLAHQLMVAGHEVRLLTWRSQYPFFYPGSQLAPNNEPEVKPFMKTSRALSWRNPVGWLRWGRRLGSYDMVILIWWVPTIQGPVYLSMLRAMGRNKPRIVVICHNVLAHEPRRGDRSLTRAVLGHSDLVIVHSAAQAEIAKQFNANVKEVELPLALPLAPTKKSHPAKLSHRLLFFGIVRPYKGLDVLLRAVAEVPDVTLLVVGEFWDNSRKYTNLIKQLHIEDRVEIWEGYAASSVLAEHIRQADVVVLPYRGGTASQHVALVHAYGTPVIATTAASFAKQVHNGVDGLLCQPNDVKSLIATIKYFYEPGVAAKLRKGIQPTTFQADWEKYIRAITG